MPSAAFFIYLHYQNMTVKQLASATEKSLPSSEVVQKLVDIEQHLIRQNKFVEALTALMQLASENLENAQVWLLIGLVYTRMANWQPAIGVLETGLHLAPQNNQIKQLMSLALFSIGKKTEACRMIDEVTKSGSANSAQWMLRAYLYAHTDSDPMKALEVAQDWGRRFADPLTRSAKPLYVKNRDLHKKLKIGYVTADFREHAIAFFMWPVLENHDNEKFDIYVYSNGPEDNITLGLKKFASHWRVIINIDDDQMFNLIREDEIDILVDLSGYTHGNRLPVFARRAAPIQVTWLGYKPTLGMKAIDYRFFNNHAEKFQQYYSEKLVKMKCPTSFLPPDYSPLCVEPPMLKNGFITFASLNNSAKITNEVLEVWSRILFLIKDARLIIYVKEDTIEAAQAHMLPRMELVNMPLDRVSVIAQQPLDRFMETGFIADAMLDTFPICGGTTVLHSIWMGMPIIAMQGNNDVDNSSANTIRGLGFGGVVAKTKYDYIYNAIGFSKNPQYIEGFRKTNREKMMRSNLMNYKERVLDMENAYRKMWESFLGQK